MSDITIGMDKDNKADQVKKSHHKLQRSLIKKLSALWLLLIIPGIVVAVGFSRILFIEKSSVLNQILNQKLTEQQVINKQIKTTTYRSDLYGFEITFNPLILRPDRATDLSQPNTAEIRLSLTGENNSGFGFIDFSAQKPNILSEIAQTNELGGQDLLEKAANWYQIQRLKDLTDTSQYVSRERIKRWDADSYKLTFKRRIFGKDVTYYSYVVIKNNKLYTITADYPKFGESAELVESWIDAISFFDPSNPESLVKGLNERKPDLDEVKLVELNKPSVVQIVSINCVSLSVAQPNSVHFLKSTYDICTGGGGSGFMVGSSGIVATNGHVAKASFEDILYNGRAEPGSGSFYDDLLREVEDARGMEASGSAGQNKIQELAKKTPSILDALSQKINDFIVQGVLTKPQFSDRYFVKLGNDPLIFGKTGGQKDEISLKNIKPSDRGKSIFDAELVGYDFSGLTALQQSAASSLSGSTPVKKEKSSDVAIIKLKSNQKSEYPGLPLVSSAQVKEGQSILVIGYPGLVSGQEAGSAGLLDETSSSVRPTITRGIISAIKQDTFGQTLLQTDASIEHGNSGGPAFSYNGDVIGIATYVISSGSGNYNFLRATDDLFALLEKNKIDKRELSQSYTYWKEGLNFFWNSQFTKAKEQFSKVKELYPLHPQVDEYLANAQKGIEEGQDADLNQNGNELKSFGYTQTQISLFLTMIMLIILGIGAGLSTYLIYDHKKKKAEQVALVQKLVEMSEKNQQPPTAV